MKTKSKKGRVTKKAAPQKMPKAKAPRETKAALVADLLQRPAGCTGADILKATGWPTVSVPQQAKAAGLKLRKEKTKGEPTRYFGAA